MKKILLPTFITLLSLPLSAQKMFAIIGNEGNQINVKNIRSIQIDAPQKGEVLLVPTDNAIVHSQQFGANIKESRNTSHSSQTSTVASLAISRDSEKLFFIPMYSSNVYVLDTRTKAITLVDNQASKPVQCNIGSHFTRMTTAANGNVYAMSNDGLQFIQISKKGEQYAVENLGAIQDDAQNQEVTLSKMMTGFGGDMIADAQGFLYVISASNNVFRIDIDKRNSEYIGAIKGLPQNFTSNGAAVNESGEIIVTSVKGEGFYTVDFETLEAKPIGSVKTEPIYDMASSFLLNDNLEEGSSEIFAGIEIYPTKISQNHFFVKVTNPSIKGNLTIEVSDYLGNKILKSKINVQRNNSEYNIPISKLIDGIYIINIHDSSGNTILNQKVIVSK